MNVSERIDQIIKQMDLNQLSKTLPLLSRVAIECKDYEGFLILFYWQKPFTSNKNGNTVQLNDAIPILEAVGLDRKTIETMQQQSFIKYTLMRSVEKDETCILSAREMEDYFSLTDNMILAAEPPKELHPVDLYFRSKEAEMSKLAILQKRRDVEKQYAILQSFITSKLAYYQTMLSQRERREKLENRIHNSKQIFIIHGHNEAKRRELSNMLKERFELEPIILSEQPDQGLTIIEKFEKHASQCSYAFAIFTPDDIVTNGDIQYFQARPNVIFELGWFYANLGRSRVCILEQASDKSSIFSDLQGVMRVQFKDNVSEKYLEIERELKSVGII